MNADTKNHIIEAIELHKEMVAAIQEDSVEVIASIAEGGYRVRSRPALVF